MSPIIDARQTATIRRRLLLLLLLPLSLLLALGVALDYASGTVPLREAYDQALANEALAVEARLNVADGTIKSDLPPQAIEVLRADGYDAIYYLVLGPHDEFIAGDAGLPLAPRGSSSLSFADAEYRGAAIRAASSRIRVAGVEGMVTITIAETTNKRTNAHRQMLAGIILTDSLQFVCILLLVWFGVGRGLRPLLTLRDQIATRSARDLAALNEAGVPGEVQPLTHALNRLFATVQEAALGQQRFLANAAHQLRTPLAGLQAQLELLARDPNAAGVRGRVVNLYDGTRRLAHTANQLLALARAESPANTAADFREVQLRTLVEEVAGAHFDRALRGQIDLGVEIADASVNGSAWLLRELLGNLVDNALTYTPSQGRVTIRCGIVDKCEKSIFLEVEDDGPGIAPADREHVVERFYRSPGASGDGCGLGLAIVDEIARAHGASLAIDSGAGHAGTRVRIVFPPMTKPASAPLPGAE